MKRRVIRLLNSRISGRRTLLGSIAHPILKTMPLGRHKVNGGKRSANSHLEDQAARASIYVAQHGAIRKRRPNVKKHD